MLLLASSGLGTHLCMYRRKDTSWVNKTKLYHTTRVDLLWQLLRPLISTTVLPSVHQRAFGCSAAQDKETRLATSSCNLQWRWSQLECINDEHNSLPFRCSRLGWLCCCDVFLRKNKSSVVCALPVCLVSSVPCFPLALSRSAKAKLSARRRRQHGAIVQMTWK